VPLYAVYRIGRRVYLPAAKPGVPLEEAERMAEFFGDAEIVLVWEPEVEDE
jgi:hypothetical protein